MNAKSTISPDLRNDGGKLSNNIMHFSRVLRKAGVPVGPGRVLDALRAVEAVGLQSRADFYWTLHAVFVNRREQRDIFEQAFHCFWRNPRLLERMMSLILPTFKGDEVPQETEPMSPRLAEALGRMAAEGKEADRSEEVQLDAALTWSRREVLNQKDFEKMTLAELAEVRKALRRMSVMLGRVRTRRFRPHPSGVRLDMRATLRATARRGGDLILPRRHAPRLRPPPLVVLCDVSGSMDRYARMMLHFLHGLTNSDDMGAGRIHSFLFGTRLTNITRHLRHRDPDKALDQVAEVVEDWSGGTRIGATLHQFNRDWSRRVLGQGAVVLLITDGLDRDGAEGMEREMDRLHKSSRRLVWLNPLLRYGAYAPKAAGARAMMAHVDDFRPIHNLKSLQQLSEVLTDTGRGGVYEAETRMDMTRWRRMAGETVQKQNSPASSPSLI